ncbi:MAG: hypothetical protein LBT44_07145 [Clostridiales bacterium]|jgi:hypothetical protein|nr:hypothetical protein [Clostridiales bacterium]
MAVDLEAMFQQEAFRRLAPEKLATFRKFATQIDGKSGPELMGVVMQFSKELSKGGAITKEERNAIIQAIGVCMAPADQPKFKNIIKMINMLEG